MKHQISSCDGNFRPRAGWAEPVPGRHCRGRGATEFLSVLARGCSVRDNEFCGVQGGPRTQGSERTDSRARSRPRILAWGRSLQGVPATRGTPRTSPGTEGSGGRCPLPLGPQNGNQEQSESFDNVFFSYQSLSFWAQAVYFLVLRGRGVGHPAQRSVRLLEQPGKRLASCRIRWPGGSQRRRMPGVAGLLVPGDTTRVATGTRPSQSRGAPPPFPGSGAAGAGRRWLGRAGPGAEAPGGGGAKAASPAFRPPGSPTQPSARPGPGGSPPPPSSRSLPIRCAPSGPPRAPVARLSITAQPPPADTGKAEVGGREGKEKTTAVPPTTSPWLRAQSRGRAS